MREEIKDNLEINEEITLKEVYIDPMENFIVDFIERATKLRGLFQIQVSTAVDANLQQIVFSTVKEWFEKSEGKINLLGLNFTTDEQISCWVNQTD